jgi:hypothetical protein
MKVLLLYVLLCLSGCASTIQIGQSRHDIGFQLLKENEGQNSTVVELRQLGVGFSLGSSQTGVMLGYKRDTSFGDVTRYPDVRPTLVMGKHTSRDYEDKNGYKSRFGFFWIKRAYKPVLVNTTNIGTELIVGKKEGNAMLGYQHVIKVKSRPEYFDSLVCTRYSSSDPMRTSVEIFEYHAITEATLYECFD